MQGLLVLVWLRDRLCACFSCYLDACHCCWLLLRTTVCYGRAGRQVTAACAGLGLQFGTLVLGGLAPCCFLLLGLCCLLWCLYIYRAPLLQRGALILNTRSLDFALLSICLWWQLYLCCRLRKAGCLIPVSRGSLNRHVATWLLLGCFSGCFAGFGAAFFALVLLLSP